MGFLLTSYITKTLTGSLGFSLSYSPPRTGRSTTLTFFARAIIFYSFCQVVAAGTRENYGVPVLNAGCDGAPAGRVSNIDRPRPHTEK
jgi:hypothetical protein